MHCTITPTVLKQEIKIMPQISTAAVDNPADYDKMFAATDSGVGKASAFPVKRETGEMPVRTRHCMQRLLSLGGELRPLETGRRRSTML
jgi:hypothetical protein